MNVTQYIGLEMEKPFVWGDTDCASTADRWFKHLHGFSAMDRYGRRPVDEESGRAWLSEPGGLFRGMRDVMNRTGLAVLTDTPRGGDVGVIILGRRACIAIFDCALWWSRDDDGFMAADDQYRFHGWRIT